MPLPLSEALAPYEAARLDASSSEGLHRDVQLTLNRSSGSRFGFWASTLRLKQNVALWSQLEAEGDETKIARFLAVFAHQADSGQRGGHLMHCLKEPVSDIRPW